LAAEQEAINNFKLAIKGITFQTQYFATACQ